MATRLTIPPAHAVVLDHLRRQILLGTHAAGERLPPEREHADQLGVSRTTLRTALRLLEAEGLVEVRLGPAGGAIVQHPPAVGVRRRRPRPSLEEMLAIQEFRLAIEPLAAARAAERCRDDALRTLRHSIDELRVARTIGPFRRADSVFHLTLARSADSPLLIRAIEEARIAMFELTNAFDAATMAPPIIEAHESILAAVESHNAAAASRAMKRHIEATARQAQEIY